MGSGKRLFDHVMQRMERNAAAHPIMTHVKYLPGPSVDSKALQTEAEDLTVIVVQPEASAWKASATQEVARHVAFSGSCEAEEKLMEHSNEGNGDFSEASRSRSESPVMVVFTDAQAAETLFGFVPIPDLEDFIL